jgi:hypothetical protein
MLRLYALIMLGQGMVTYFFCFLHHCCCMVEVGGDVDQPVAVPITDNHTIT